MPRILLTLTALLTAIVVAVGCGDDSSSSSEAAALAPGGSIVYAEATLAPEGDQKTAVNTLIEKFPGQGSAGERVRSLLEKAFKESDSKLSYEEDVEPWVGDEAAFFLTSLDPAGEDPPAAGLVATDDEDKTVDAIEKDEPDARKTSYKDHDLYTFEDDSAAAVLEGWLVIGNPKGVKAAIDTVEDGKPIDDDEEYQQALDEAPEERLGFLYVNTPALIDQVKRSEGGEALQQFEGMFEDPFLTTVDADDEGVRLEATVPESFTKGFPIVAEGSDLAADLPGDAWLAMAQPELGKAIETYLDAFASQVGGRDTIEQQLKATTGLDLQQDVISWMGDWSVFVRGTTLSELGGAVIIETSDEAASQRFIRALARLARQSAEPGTRVGPLDLPGGGEGVTLRTSEVPQPIHLFQRNGKVVAAYGDSAAQDAIDPREKLGDSPAYADAEKALGGDYVLSFYLAVPEVLELVESFGVGSDSGYQEAKPYLEPLKALVAGATKDGDKLRSAFGITID